MSNIILGSGRDIGRREVYEDRVQVASFKTAGGVQLSAAIIADGVGGANKGERAAQLAIDAAIQHLQNSPETNIPTLLTSTAQTANQAVYSTRFATGKAGCTLTIALIDKNNVLYIANVGDSRAYLVRNEKVSQLTIDHNFANMMVMQGKMDRPTAEANPRADVLMRALGQKEQIAVDIGFYVSTLDYHEANERGQEGLPLREGDTILVCTDGLIKPGPDGIPYTTDEEIGRTLSVQEGDKAARELISFALGRNADDNISVALLQIPDPKRNITVATERKRSRQMVAGAGAAVVLAMLTLIIYSLLNFAGSAEQNAIALEQQSTQNAILIQMTQGVIQAQSTQDAVHIQMTQDVMQANSTQDAIHIASTWEALNHNSTRDATNILLTQEAVSQMGTSAVQTIIKTKDASDATQTQEAIHLANSQEAAREDSTSTQPSVAQTQQIETRVANLFDELVIESETITKSASKEVDAGLLVQGKEIIFKFKHGTEEETNVSVLFTGRIKYDYDWRRVYITCISGSCEVRYPNGHTDIKPQEKILVCMHEQNTNIFEPDLPCANNP